MKEKSIAVFSTFHWNNPYGGSAVIHTFRMRSPLRGGSSMQTSADISAFPSFRTPHCTVLSPSHFTQKRSENCFLKRKQKRIKMWTISRHTTNPTGFHCTDVLLQRWENGAAGWHTAGRRHSSTAPCSLSACFAVHLLSAQAWKHGCWLGDLLSQPYQHRCAGVASCRALLKAECCRQCCASPWALLPCRGQIQLLNQKWHRRWLLLQSESSSVGGWPCWTLVIHATQIAEPLPVVWALKASRCIVILQSTCSYLSSQKHYNGYLSISRCHAA